MSFSISMYRANETKDKFLSPCHISLSMHWTDETSDRYLFPCTEQMIYFYFLSRIQRRERESINAVTFLCEILAIDELTPIYIHLFFFFYIPEGEGAGSKPISRIKDYKQDLNEMMTRRVILTISYPYYCYYYCYLTPLLELLLAFSLLLLILT